MRQAGFVKVVLVTGSRDWGDVDAVVAALSKADPELLVHGACPSGADRIAAEWAIDAKVPALTFPALWGECGKAAGPIRNSEMVGLLDLLRIYGHEVEVHAFPRAGSNGTRDCIAKAKAKLLHVIVHGR